MFNPSDLSLRRLVAQMFVVRASGHLFDSQIRYPAWEPARERLQHWIEDWGIGGVLLIDGSVSELRLRTEQLQGWAEIPLLLCADIEEGVGQRFTGATWFPPPMALGEMAREDLAQAEGLAREMGQWLASEAVAAGLNWILAPVVDVNNNPENPVINVRSFSDNPGIVTALATAFIEGTQTQSVLTTAKHFPGHGDTSVDSHWQLPKLPHDAQRLDELELLPFRGAIAAGVDAVMTAHVQVPLWDEQAPVTLSPKILREQLRGHLGFEGLVVTDALVMGAIANQYDAREAAVLAVEAGNDIVLMPEDLPGGIEAVCEAVQSGRISRDRILESVQRIAKAKEKLKPSTTSALPDLAQVSRREARALGDRILQGSGQGRSGAVAAVKQGYNLVIVDDWLRSRYLDHHSPAIALPKQQGYQPYLLDLHGDRHPSAAIISQPTIVQVFIRGNPFGSSAALANLSEEWLNKLLRDGDLRAIAIYGSPYSLKRFLRQIPTSVPYAFSFGQMAAAQEVALSQLFPDSRLDWSSLTPLA
ncbi:glycoside hydrolase family 3 N-terminal domain-containing protein [Sodalinema gerasimenkoae]|uniref:glycoside hydrolase family 3 N-terminal domain-containing protein n=1 Tax=Sodalinema gerasimenkoae TaxID=2862348 RepID=UPI00135B8129|nr:glycoside hydrolase family 3 N-terminal domain-containing protein [Sodalinema gerasimenkoae]